MNKVFLILALSSIRLFGEHGSVCGDKIAILQADTELVALFGGAGAAFQFPAYAGFAQKNPLQASTFDLGTGSTAITKGQVNSVALLPRHGFFTGLIGAGGALTPAYAAFVYPATSEVSPLNLHVSKGQIYSVAMVELNGKILGLIGGYGSNTTSSVNPPYAAFVEESNLSVNPISLGIPKGAINRVSLLSTGTNAVGLLTGDTIVSGHTPPYAAFIDYNAQTVSPILLTPTDGLINGSAMREYQGDIIALIGGSTLMGSPPYAAFLSLTGASETVIPLGIADGLLWSTALVEKDQKLIGLIGGASNDTLLAYAAFVDYDTNTVFPINLGSGPGINHGQILSVALSVLDNEVVGLIGGGTGLFVVPTYAAFVNYTTNTVIPIALPSGNGTIELFRNPLCAT